MFKVLGVDDSVSVCDCCGKSNLKKTVVLENDGGEILHYGSDCAGAALLGRKNRKNGIVAFERAVRIGKCRAVVDIVKDMIAAGIDSDKANAELKKLHHSYSVSYGYYSDTWNEKPLRIWYGGDSVPGVDIPASEINYNSLPY